MLKLKAYTLSLCLIPGIAFTETTNCKEFALQQLKEVKQDYYGALTRDEVDLTLHVAKRSCEALFKTVEEERKELQSQAKNFYREKQHWWEQREAEGKAVPAIRKATTTGGK